MKLHSLPLLLALVATTAFAQDDSRDRAERIAKALNLEQMLASARTEGIKASRQQMLAAMEELERSGVPKDAIAKLTPLADQMATKLAAAWDAKEAARIYAAELIGVLSEKELADAAKYYESPEGKKIYSALQASLAKTYEYINQKTSAAMQVEYKEFLKQVQDVVRGK